MVPLVGKGERLDVFMEIKGSGQIDAEALNRFHGVHFGDEVESDDLPSTDSPEDEEEDVVEATEEAGEEAASEEEASPSVTWREDVLLRVMDASGIDVAHRDAFVAHAANFDHDDNGYLKKAELEAAANAWNENSDEAVEEEAPAEEVVTEDEAPVEEAAAEEMACPMCDERIPADSTSCSACHFVFV
jgi:hypothetical protein